MNPFSEKAKEFKRDIMKRVPSPFKLKLIFSTNKTLNYFSNKSKTELGLKANLVYQFDCHKCHALYIGETNRHLRTRIAEHTQKSRTSSILDHVNKCISKFKLNNKETLSQFNILMSNFDNYYERIIGEALLIKKCKPVLNIQNDSTNHIKVF